MIKPKKLQPGDKVAAVSLSWGGPGTLRAKYEHGKKQLEDAFGVTVVEMTHTCADPGFVYNNPQARAQDLMDAFNDPSIKGIVATIGGDDSIRILPFIDFDIIRNNPKVFMGYSDTTITHLICNKAGLTSFYGPAMMSGFGENGGLHTYLKDSVQQALFTTNAAGILAENKDGWTVKQFDWNDESKFNTKRPLNPCEGWQYIQGHQEATGHLFGGCMEVLTIANGTDIWPTKDQWKDAVLFLETSEDAPPAAELLYFIRNLGAQGLLDNMKAVLLARPGGDKLDPEKDFPAYDAALIKGLAEYGRSDIPVVTRMDFGHTDPMMVIPYGISCTVDPQKKQVRFNEPGVC